MSRATALPGASGAHEDSAEPEQTPTSPLAGDTPLSVRRAVVASGSLGAAAERAELHAACELEPDDLLAEHGWIERHFGHRLQLDVVLDPSVVGGIWVRVGDIVIDGSLRGRLEALRHHLRAQCRAMVSSGLVDYGGEAPTQ